METYICNSSCEICVGKCKHADFHEEMNECRVESFCDIVEKEVVCVIVE